MRFILPIHTVSESNRREHWGKHAKRKASQRSLARACTAASVHEKLEPPFKVKLSRMAPRLLDPGNVPGALKHVQDGFCDAIGYDDRAGTGITWEYGQVKTKAKQYGVLVEITRKRKGEHDED